VPKIKVSNTARQIN